MKTIKAFAPATIANFNVGYDVLGLSLNNIGDEVRLTENGSEENKITAIINGENLPKEVEKNCCSVVIRAMQEELNTFNGVDIQITKGFEVGSGLGSSSASSAAAAYAYNALVDRPFTTKELVRFAAEGERVACGSVHADNVAPSLLGGIVLANGINPKDIIELPIIDDLFAISLFPKIRISTSESRKILKDMIPLASSSKQTGLMATFISSLYENDINRLSYALKDVIIEPMRSLLIPKFQEMKAAALNNAGLAFGISGSGPSVFALAKGLENAERVLSALEVIYKQENIEFTTYINELVKDSGSRIIA